MKPVALQPPAADSPVAWDAQGAPVSVRFGDRYRNEGIDGLGGLAQARYVFLAGCGLCAADGAPQAGMAWCGAAKWRVLENGFGLGLNFLATWQLWQRDPQRPAALIYDATEAFVPTADDLRRAASPFPELHALAEALATGWTRLRQRGELRLDAGGAVRLRLREGDALPALQAMEPGVDSVFLDGFDPPLNPAMWSPALMQSVGRLARPGAALATWCVAGSVRRALTAAGFSVVKRDGLPPKRHCLVARKQPAAPTR